MNLLPILFGEKWGVQPKAPSTPPETLIHRLCRTSGKWAVTAFDGLDIYTVRTTQPRGRVLELLVRCDGHRERATRFHCQLPVRFPLDNPPSGLFGRLLLRGTDLCWCSWHLCIGESCEAVASVSVLIPNSGLDAKLFDYVCNEMTGEVEAFQKELHDKFNYSFRFDGSPGVPVIRSDNLPRRQ